MVKNMKRKIIKSIFTIALGIIVSMNSFAAVVADNDGSAFITKSEFDSLKNDFQSKLDSYNSSIDSKIDNAIASYLQGIKVAKEITLSNLYSKLNDKGKWINMAWGAIYNGANTKYPKADGSTYVKTYRLPNFTDRTPIGGWVLGFNEVLVGDASVGVCDSAWFNSSSTKGQTYGGAVLGPNVSKLPVKFTPGYDYFGVTTDSNGNYYYDSVWGERVLQGWTGSVAYRGDRNAYSELFMKTTGYSGEEGSLVWGDWTVSNIGKYIFEDAGVMVYTRIMDDHPKTDISYWIPIAPISDEYNGVAGISNTQDIAIQPTKFVSNYCYATNSWAGVTVSSPGTFITNRSYASQRNWAPNSYQYACDQHKYHKVLPWHKFAKPYQIYVGASNISGVKTRIGEGMAVTKITDNGTIHFPLAIDGFGDAKRAKVIFYISDDPVPDFYIMNDKLMKYSIWDDKYITKYAETNEYKNLILDVNYTYYIELKAENVSKKGYLWIKVFPYNSETNETICDKNTDYVTLNIGEIKLKVDS